MLRQSENGIDRSSPWCRKLIVTPVCFLGVLCFLSDAFGEAVPTRVVRTGDSWRLEREEEPFVVRGAGGSTHLDLMKAAGANSLRTWGADDDLEDLLDEAHQRGLTVTIGIWLGHERHGFDYTNSEAIIRQEEQARQAILRYRDHPALLMWGIGNEMEGQGDGGNPAIWMAVNRIARIAKELDSNHPTMTTTAEIGGKRVASVHRFCPDIDIMGINSYGGSRSIPERYRAAGGSKPYLITEFGPLGVWEASKTEFGAPFEQTSTEKSSFYAESYQKFMADRRLCVGSYVFYWGNKQEATATWYGMFLQDGSKLAPVDVMTELWSGKKPENLCPRITGIKLVGGDVVQPKTEVKVNLQASDPDGDPLTAEWVLQQDADTYHTAGDVQAVPLGYEDAIVRGDATGATLRIPDDGGRFRVFAYLRDGKGGAAVANVPIRINAPERSTPAARVKFPFTLYGDHDEPLPYSPSGWMGNTNAMKLDPAWKDKPHAGTTCVRMDYTAEDDWAGIVWMHPENDWGDRRGGYDLSGASKLTFWARGETGGERIQFEFGILGRDKRHYDTAKGKKEVVLSDKWTEHTIDLEDKDLSRIKTGFVCVVAGQGRPLTFYLDDIRYAAE